MLLDFEKAYDKVDWGFLEGTLHRMGFPDAWIRGISALYRSASAAVTIETMALYLRGRTQIQGLHMPIDGSLDLVEQEYVDDTMIFCDPLPAICANERKRAPAIYSHLQPPSRHRSAAKDGLQFKDWEWWPNTLHAHRLVLLADSVGKGGEANQELFRLTYEEGQNISDLEVLCAAANRLGLSGAREYLMSDEGKQEVIKQDRAAKSEKKIDSVPFFIVNDSYPFSGAQDAATIEKVIRKAVSL
ncbi:hypothetical protein L7F22_060997 [Adiantum nelumboides]|nr:hypothetical protein [Adiantum nelumboides]